RTAEGPRAPRVEELAALVACGHGRFPEPEVRRDELDVHPPAGERSGQLVVVLGGERRRIADGDTHRPTVRRADPELERLPRPLAPGPPPRVSRVDDPARYLRRPGRALPPGVAALVALPARALERDARFPGTHPPRAARAAGRARPDRDPLRGPSLGLHRPGERDPRPAGTRRRRSRRAGDQRPAPPSARLPGRADRLSARRRQRPRLG